MRKVFLTLSAVVALVSMSHAQTKFGLKAGANIAQLKASGGGISFTYDSKVGLHAGGFATIPVASNISFQPELLYSMEGAKINDENAKIDLSYLNVPLMIQYNASGLIVETGPQVGLLLSAKAKDDDESEDIKEELNSTSFSWGFGAGYRLSNGLGIHGRYNLGLSNLAKDDSSEGTIKSNVIQIGLSFALGGSSSN
jgi:hypothetical protein